MRTKKLILKSAIAFFILLIVCCSLPSCKKKYDRYNGLILTDENTGKRYLLIHNGTNYNVREQTFKISGKDTLVVFE